MVRAESRYRILLPLGPDLATNLATVDSLLAHVAVPETLLMAGEKGRLQSLRRSRPGLPGESVETQQTATDGPQLAYLLGLVPDDDVLLVTPGILAVPLLDVRLAWSATVASGIAGVSPLCDLEPLTAPKRHGLWDADPVVVDGRLSAAQSSPLVDAPHLLPECFYLRRAAVDGLAVGAWADADELSAALRQRGMVLAWALHVYVGTSRPLRDERKLAVAETEGALERPVKELVERVLTAPLLEAEAARGLAKRKVRPRLLHVTHSLGGGLDRWVEQFAAAESTTESWLLRSVGERGRFGSELWLFDAPAVQRPRRTWRLSDPIAATAVHHLGYRAALDDIVTDLGIEAVLVSSLIGHSMDALRTGLPSAFVCHDYYPFCSALHIHFDGVCTSCDATRLQRCRMENPVGELFEDRDAKGWLAIRDAFLESVKRQDVRLTAPSASVERHYRRLAAELTAVPFTVIEHGADNAGLLALRESRRERRSEARRGPLRAVVLGRLSPVKGRRLFMELASLVAGDVTFHLVGCGGAWAAGLPAGVEVVAEYESAELAGILARVDPDVALLLSIAPETFSFTLSECFAAAIPPLATRVGSFEDRITDGVTGFLEEPSAQAIAARLHDLAADRQQLAEVEGRLTAMEPRGADRMVSDYVRLLGLPPRSPRSYFSRVAGAVDTPSGAAAGADTWLPPASPLGFRDFWRQFELGTRRHIRSSRRLRPWQRRLVMMSANVAFGLTRWLWRRL